MLEATPGEPYGHDLGEFLEVEKNMRRRCYPTSIVHGTKMPGES
jgi:hypothetical protein